LTGAAGLRKAGLTGLVLLGIGAALWWGREVRPSLAPEDRLARLLVPVEGQNANLYDRQWAEVLGKNRKVLEVFP
jgi:hypothetical protein